MEESLRDKKPANASLFETEDRWVSNVGGFFVESGEVRYRDHSLHGEFLHTGWMRLLAYGITGRQLQDHEVALLEGLWSLAVSYPDPRIWNNRIAALGGTVRTTANLACTAAAAVSEAEIYGHRANVGAIDFLFRAQRLVQEGASLADVVRQELKTYRVIYGYGRPLRSLDERIEPVMTLATELGLADGPYTTLAFEVEKELISKWRQRMNITALAAALCADMGFSTDDYRYYIIPAFLAGIIPVCLDAMDHDEGTFFPLRCDRIAYAGVPRRQWEG